MKAEPSLQNDIHPGMDYTVNADLSILSKRIERIEVLLNGIHQLLSTKPSIPPPEILTIMEAAAYLRLSVKRLYELLYAGKLESLPHKKHHRLLFSKKHLNQYIYETNEQS